MRTAALEMVLVGVVLMCLTACPGKEEADAMTKFADQMCACTSVECVDKLFPEVEKLGKANENKEVEASAADRYNAQMDRTQKCYEAQQKK